MVKLEAWEDEVKVLDQYDSAYHLNDQAKLIALEMLFRLHTTVWDNIER